MNLLNVVIFGAGAILVYSAIKNKNPKDVITSAISSTSTKTSPAPTPAPKTAPAVYHVPYPVVSV